MDSFMPQLSVPIYPYKYKDFVCVIIILLWPTKCDAKLITQFVGHGICKLIPGIWSIIFIIICSWKRHVKLRTISGLLRAEVIYITPAGRKLRTYGEVEKALEVMDTVLTKDNFSFSNKLQVGTFYLPCESQVGRLCRLLLHVV